MTSPTPAAARTVTTRGLSRARYGAALGAAAAAVALFVLWSLNIGHGVYAAIVLGLAAVALTFFGGPERLARTITISRDSIRIERFHRVGSVIARSELSGAVAHASRDQRGRTRAVLVLTPRDPIRFFVRHRELRSVRVDNAAHVPAGTSEQTVRELTEALSAA